MSINSLAVSLLLILLVLIYLGLLERVLERLKLSRKQALFLLLAIILGGELPSVQLYRGLHLNLGGMLIPLAVVTYLIATADEAGEKKRSFISIAVTMVAVWVIDRLLPLEPGLFWGDLDPLYLPALAGAAVAYGLGRSRRASFSGAFTGVLFIDLAAWGENLVRGYGDIRVVLGGGGVFGAALIAGVIAVLLAEALGEIRERYYRGS